MTCASEKQLDLAMPSPGFQVSMHQDKVDLVLSTLRTLGWTACAGRPDYVALSVQTAVGEKTASAHCTVYLGEGLVQVWIHGRYVSEGRCALEACKESFDASAPTSQVQAKATAFHTEALRRIGETYAATLWVLANNKKAGAVGVSAALQNDLEKQ